MKKLLTFIMGIIPLLTFPQTVALNPAREIEATVHVQARGDAIDPRMFGMFIEHLGNVDVGPLHPKTFYQFIPVNQSNGLILHTGIEGILLTRNPESRSSTPFS